jgi:hypothetical protein
LASLLIVVLLAGEPPRQSALAEPAASAVAAVSMADAAPAAPPAAAKDKPAGATLAELESKAPDSLSVRELLLLNEGRAERKRETAQALFHKLQSNPDLAKDESVQAELLRLAADPDTAATALAAMAEARSPIGLDLLYEVWTSRSTPAGTAELARSLLYSQNVRPNASAALAVALELRAASSCEAVLAALPRALSDGDRRSSSTFAKLNSRRGCGTKKTQDCYPCLRSEMKRVVAATVAVKSRNAPSYPTR